MVALREIDAATRRLAVVAGMASYLDAAALVASGLAVGGFYAPAFELSPLAVGLLLGLQTVAFATGAVLGGHIGDRAGRRRVLIASLALYVLGIGILAAATGVVSLAVGLTISGLAIGGDLPVSLAIIGEEAPEGAKGRLIAFSQVLWIAGIGTMGALGVIASGHGVTAGRTLYAFLFVVGSVVLAMRLRLRESRDWIAADAKRASRIEGGRSDGPLGHISTSVWMTAAVLGIYYALWNLGANTLGQFRPYLWINVFGGDPRGISWLILAVLPIGLAGTMLFTLVVDGPAQRRWFICGSLISIAGWLLVSLRLEQSSFVSLCVMFSVGASTSGEVVFKVWVQRHVPVLARARVQGATVAVARLLAAGAAVVTPLIATWNVQFLFSSLAIANIAALAVALFGVRRFRGPAPIGAIDDDRAAPN
ncbi:MFS transporter [Nocardioides KLBMP 9356]|uniref:MFS transporter n=1 Tax=Nocardioides potassii TaxID=2911371 RepID=A0ABS9H7V5_9ACTN|nr:MFS transporter [Nocardioides potassii]MCF6376347.1 MFS transporter [Nocardioides potassii]